jgi:hypothetical protein
MEGGIRVALAKPRLFAALFLTVLLLVSLGAFTAYASEGEPDPPVYGEIIPINNVIDTMIVNATWLDDEMLRIDVVDIITGAVSSLAVRLSDFVTNADAQNSRYILIQAVDLDGNLSGIVQIANPFYVPVPIDTSAAGISPPVDSDDNSDDDAEQQGLTPDGSSTVIDNVTTQNEIEFFTVYTEEGNVFFLVVDRQRNSDNVYLLNAVTEADLMALAEQSGNPIENNSISAVPAPPTVEPPADEQEQPALTQPEPEPETPSGRGSNNNWIFILLVALGVGGAAYYFKIVKGKKSSAPDDDDWGYDEDMEDGGDEDDYLSSDGIDEGGGDE